MPEAHQEWQQLLVRFGSRAPLDPEQIGGQWLKSSSGYICGGDALVARFAVADLAVAIPRCTMYSLALFTASEGESRLWIGDERHQFRPRPGQVLLLPCDRPVLVRHDGLAELLQLNFAPQRLAVDPTAIGAHAGTLQLPSIVGNDDRVLCSLMSALHEAEAEQRAPLNGLVAGLLQALCAHLCNHYAVAVVPTPALSDMALQMLETYVAERADEACDAAQAADLLGLSRKRLLHDLRARTGQSFGSFVRDTRLRLARRALIEGGRSVTDVAYDHGFANLSHFSRAFHKRFGLPPSRIHAQSPVAAPVPAADAGSVPDWEAGVLGGSGALGGKV